MTKKRQKPDDRKHQILMAAIAVAERPGGFAKITRESVAKEACCAEALVSRYFGTMANFKRTLMGAALVSENLAVIAQGLAAGDSRAMKADSKLKARALITLAG